MLFHHRLSELPHRTSNDPTSWMSVVSSSWQTATGEVLDASTQFCTLHVQAERLASLVGGKSLLITWSTVSHLLSGFANAFTGCMDLVPRAAFPFYSLPLHD